MIEQLISFETAKLVKEKGFDIEFASYYDESGELLTDIDFPSLQPTKPKNWLSAPTQSLLQKWLREVHEMYITVHYWTNQPTNKRFLPIAWGFHVNGESKGIPYSTYEEALERGLLEALKLIKS